MVDNVFKISIVAVDKATAVARKVNAAFSAFTKPVSGLQKSIAALSKETGLNKLAKSGVKAASALGTVAGQARGILVPLAAIAGVGVTASIVEMTHAWIDQGAEISRTSRLMGIYTSDLQSTRAVSRLFGVDAGSASSALNEFGNTVQGAVFGRNQDALAMLNALHVGVVRLKNGSIDTITMMKRVADSAQFQRANANTKQFIASTLGLSGMLPVMLQGSAAIDAYAKRMQDLGAVQSPRAIAQAEQFSMSLTFLNASVTGVGNAIAGKLIPVFQPIIDKATAWIGANRELIAQRFDYYARRIADAIDHINWKDVKDGLHSVVDGVKSVVGALGSLKNTAIVVAIALNASLLTSIVRLGIALVEFAGIAGGVAIRGVGMLVAGLAPLALKVGVAFEALAGLTAEIPLVGAAMEGLSGAFVALGVAIEATPVGWIITGLAAVAFAGYEIYEHWTQLKNLFNRFWDGSPFFRSFFAATNPMIFMAVEVAKHWDAVWQKFKAIGSWLRDSWMGKLVAYEITGSFDGFQPDRNAGAPQKTDAPQSSARPAAAGGASSHLRTSAETVGRHFPANSFSRAPVVAAASVPAVASDPRGIRNNNPGNLRYAGQAGAGSDGAFATFGTMQDGVAALNHQLKLYEGRGINTVDSIFSKYAPANENNTPAYKASVAKDLGVSPNQKLTLDGPTLAKLDRAIVKVEDGPRWVDKIFGPDSTLSQKFGAMALAAGTIAAPMPIAAATPTITAPPPAVTAPPLALAAQATPAIAAPSLALAAHSAPAITAPSLTLPVQAALAAPMMLAPSAPAMPGPYSQQSTQAAAAVAPAVRPGAAGEDKFEPMVTITFANAPAGMTATATGRGAERVALRVEHAMPGVRP